MRHRCIILADSPGALFELCGISLLERLLRTLQRLGLTNAIVVSATPDLVAQQLANPSPHRAKVAIDLRRRANGPVTVKQIAEAWPNDVKQVLVIPGESVFDPRLLQFLDDQNASAALVDSAPPSNLQPLLVSARETARGRLCGASTLSNEWVQSRAGSLDEALCEEIGAGNLPAIDVASCDPYLTSGRRKLRLYWFPLPTTDQRPIAQHVLLDAAQKGTLDLPAMVHAPIENFLVSYLCQTAITPNQLSALTNIVAWGATALFATGHLGAGVILALVVGILDGLDGKQARLKIETTKMGKLEHWFDALFEISWWVALAYYLQTSGWLPGAFAYLALLLCAEGAAGLAKLSVLLRFGRLIDEIGDFDRVVRLFGGRRNIYVWIFALGVLFRAPGQTFKVIAWWGAITAAIQVPRAVFILWVRRNQTDESNPHAEG